ncbi:MAG: hypothetical protein U1F63_07655 [Chitinivorax sp.]|jgi:hypothetical protein
MKQDKNLDPETVALLEWCTQVEAELVARGASRREAQQNIEEQADWYTDLFYEGFTPEQAASEALNE